MAGFYPVTSGIENGLSHLQKKVDQGYFLMAFPEGTRSNTNKIKRFHKGAFYLAEELKLDIIPVLIQGNSEVNPKGSFIIKDGGLTLKILDRIPNDDTRFGANSREKTKAISKYFKEEFDVFRKEIEHDSYFHPVVLEDFRYKGIAIYKTVKTDLKKHAKNYKIILDFIGIKDKILHLSNDFGQLDFLLALDRPDRKIFTFIVAEHERAIVKNSYITNTHYSISTIDSIEEALENKTQVTIINSENVNENQLKSIANSSNIFILLKESRNLFTETILQLGYQSIIENETLIILKK